MANFVFSDIVSVSLLTVFFFFGLSDLSERLSFIFILSPASVGEIRNLREYRNLVNLREILVRLDGCINQLKENRYQTSRCKTDSRTYQRVLNLVR